MLKVITSKKISKLGDELISQIKSFKDFFNTPFCVFNNKNMESWFKTYWLKKEENVLMNIKFLNISSILDEFKNDNYSLASNEDITFKLMDLSFAGNIEYKYIYDDDKLSSPKIRDFCLEITRYFSIIEKNDFSVAEDLKNVYDSLTKELAKDNKYLLREYINKLNIHNINSPIYVFSTNKLEKSYYNLFEKLSEVNDIYLFINDNKDNEIYNSNVEVKEAPSEIREVELLHSTICDLLKNSDVSTSDIIVYAPSMGKYTEIIERVFRQDGKEFVDIQYVVKTKEKKESNITKALKIMIDIIHKGYYTRYDFYKIATNSLIRYKRNISNDEMNVMIDIIEGMNIYRSKKDDFHKGKKRILLQKLLSERMECDNLVEMKDGLYIPFGMIDLNDEIIIKFIDLVDDLNCILELNDDNLMDRIVPILDKWFSIKDYNDFETNKMHIKVLKIIENFKRIKNKVNIDLVFNYLINNTTIPNGTIGEILTSGITFLDLNPNCIIPGKYIFMLGMDSSSFPFNEEINEFYSLKELPSKESISRELFFDLIANGDNLVYISYCSSDLKTDEKFYPTLFVGEMKDCKSIAVAKTKDKKGKEIIKIDKIDIDETRPYNELYTKREFKNKEYYLNLFKNKELKDEETIINNESYNHTNEEKISLSSLSKFIMEPLINKTDRLMENYEDNYEDIKDEYEPLEVNNLDEAIIESDLVIEMLEDIKEKLSDDFDLDEYLDDPKAEKKSELILDGLISDDKYGDIVFDSMMAKAKKVVKGLIEKVSSDYEVVTIPFVEINYNGDMWKLTCNKKFYLHIDGNKRYYAKSKSLFGKLTNEIKEYLEIYIFSLMDIINIENDDYNKEYEIYLFGYEAKNRYEKTFNISKNEAINALNNLYAFYNDYNNNKCLPLDTLLLNEINGLYDLFDLVSKKEWKYSKNNALFNYEKDLGYDDRNFDEMLSESIDEVINLISPLKAEEKKNED